VFGVAASGTDPRTYQWRKDGLNLADGGAVSGANTPTVTISPASLADAGSYDCIVSNDCGSVTSNAATLTVCAGDINCDESVDFGDFLAFFNAYDAGC
jgi:hypothetical protein